MPPLSPSERARLATANQTARTLIRTRIEAYARASWTGLGSWRDPDIDRWVAQMVPRVQAAQLSVANLTDNYFARALGTSAVGAIRVDQIRGVPAADVYRRPASTLYTELSKGKGMTAALSASTARAIDLAATDVQLAQTHQAQASLQGGGAQFYQRVLVGAENCALCVIASTQAYWVSDLMPIHPGCNCDVDELARDTPRFEALDGSMRVIDPETLQRTHDQVASVVGSSDRSAREPDYRKLLIVREHGEIGPVLTFRHQKFTGPNDI